MVKDTDVKRIDDIGELVRKRRGGSGKSKLPERAKMEIILSNLPSDKYMDQKKPGFSLGLSAAELLRKFPHTPHWNDKKIIDNLEVSGQIIARIPSASDRVDKYFYRTDEGNQFLNFLIKMKYKKGIRKKVDKSTGM